MKRLLTGLALCLAGSGWATPVPLPSTPVTIDGDLREWGRAAWIIVAPAGDGVGLRGVFAGAEDHDAVVLVQWDARALYIAAAIHDDTLDVGRVTPAEREWRGPAGERKDRMFYFDHFKIFVREPGADAGYNLWLAPPLAAGGAPYWWGGRQRRAPGESPPIELAATVRPGVRSFELAVPWTWMEAYPQPGDELDALFLFTDADRPDAEVATKIRSDNDRWIWWQGVLELTGTPAGLRQRPEPEPLLSTVPPPAGPPDPRIARAITRSRQQTPDTAATAAVAVPAATMPARGEPVASGSSVSTPAAAPAAARGAQVEDDDGRQARLRALLNRRRLGRQARSRAPDWIRQLAPDPRLSVAQIDSFYVVLRRHLIRIVEEGVTSRVDVYVIDMADVAGCARGQARAFLVALLDRLAAPPDETLAAHLAGVASSSGLPRGTVEAFVRVVAENGRALFAEHRVDTSEALIQRGMKAAGLSREQALELVAALIARPSDEPAP